MLIRHLDGARRRDLRVSVADPDATVADLATALVPHLPPGPLLVDGRAVAAATPLDRAGIGDGAVVARPPAADLPPPPVLPPSVVAVTVTAGPDAGRVVPLAPGTHLLGRRPGADVHLDDPTASAAHARIEVDADGGVTLLDLGSTNGTWIDGVATTGVTSVPPHGEVRCGASRFEVGPAPEADLAGTPTLPAGAARTRPLHRRPRQPAPRPPAPVAVPPEPGPPPPVSPVGVVAVLASVATGAAAVVLLHSWSYAALALLGPLLVVANALDSRRRRRRHRRRTRRRRARELRLLARNLSVAAEVELIRRRAAAPGPAAASAIAGAAGGSATPGALWERRLGHDDACTVRVGIGAVRWDPPLATAAGDEPGAAGGVRPSDDVAAAVRAHAVLPDAPVALRLEPGRPVAVVGPVDAARALVRAVLVQTVVQHGPADVRVAVLAAADRAEAWDWCGWLPHADDAEVGPLLAGSEARGQAVVEALAAAGCGPDATPDRCTLVVVDDPGALAARRSAARSLLRLGVDPRTGVVPIVLVADAADVPASCHAVLAVDACGALVAPDLAVGEAAVVGTADDVACEVARALARFDDPELDDPGRDLPSSVALGDLLGGERLTAAGTVAAWRAGGQDPPPRAVVGASPDGPFVVDLAVDGPHALVAGTTGAGKSELLRTLVASLAAGSSPRHLTFVLVDFKGGSAFDACARLPHVTGVVTDLDDHLAARALRCLDAELRRREERLRAAGAEDLAELRRRDPDGEALPRLVVVVDEFATLAAELPDFVDSLVGVAQRGRSLGVHLVLATQRPSGAVSERIRANTALRVALRVHDAADSTDVVDAPGAAALPRRTPGRALVRLGPGELVAVQVARATGPGRTLDDDDADADDDCRARAPVTVRSLRVADDRADDAEERGSRGSAGAVGAPSDLDLLVDAAVAAWERIGDGPPRRPWPEPLPLELSGAVPADAVEADHLVLGLADRPEHQRHEPWCWALGQGPLLAVGLPGSGTTTVAATAVIAAATRWSPGACHVHVVDLGAGGLEPLAGLPHVGAVIGADDLERQRRLVAELTDEMARRRAAGADRSRSAAPPRRLVVVDGIGAFRARWPDVDPSGTWDRFVALVADGSSLGIHVLVTAEGVASAPHRLVAACRQRLVLRLGERADHAAFGIPAAAVPELPPGRGITAEGGLLVQVVRPADGWAAAVARLAGRHPAIDEPDVAPVGRLPSRVDRRRVGRASTGADGSVSLPLGIADEGLVPAVLHLGPGGHAVVAGPPRSGRTTTLLALGRAAVDAGIEVVAVAVDPAPWTGSGVAHLAPTDDLAPLLDRPGPLVVLVDDADRTDDHHPVLAALAGGRRPDRHVVAAARADRLRAAYGHWTRELRADRTGILLAPDPDLDGDLLGTRVPRHLGGRLPPGRGWACGSEPEGLVQVSGPDPVDRHEPLPRSPHFK